MLYTLASVFLLAALAKCEPPVQGYHGTQNGYLPPRTGYTAPSNSYLPPTAGYHGGSGGSGGYGGSAGFGGSGSFGGSAGSGGHGGDSHGHSHENEVPKSYEFGYSVKDAQSGNDYGRRESSDGSVVRGEYRVQLPDGRLQIVTYHADWQTGFHADVRYEGEARYPEPQHNTGGYNYNNPEFSGSLTGFHGNAGHGNGNGNGIGVHQPSPAYGPPGYH